MTKLKLNQHNQQQTKDIMLKLKLNHNTTSTSMTKKYSNKNFHGAAHFSY